MRNVATAVQVLSTAAAEKIKMQLLRVACVLSAVQAYVAPHVARQPRHAMRGAPEEAADAKIDSFVKDNKARVGVRGDARPPNTPSTRRYRR